MSGRILAFCFVRNDRDGATPIGCSNSVGGAVRPAFSESCNRFTTTEGQAAALTGCVGFLVGMRTDTIVPVPSVERIFKAPP